MGGGRRPLVSIAVPVYRAEAYIERCARSLFEQTYENLEFIFVDDASPDKSFQILERVISEYPERAEHIRILHHETNKGLTETRNALVANAKGDFIFFVDSDDWVELNAVELLVNRQLETGADIVTANAYYHNKNGCGIYTSGGWDLDKETMLEELLKGTINPVLWRRLISRKLYVEHDIKGDVNVSIAEDNLVLPRLVYYADSVAGIENVIYHHDRLNEHSTVTKVSKSYRLHIESYTVVYHSLTAFFSDKERRWQDALENYKVKLYHYNMLRSAYYRDRNNYNRCLDLLTHTDSRFWYLVRWNNLFFRKLESNYFLARKTYPIRMFLQKLKNNDAKNR